MPVRCRIHSSLVSMSRDIRSLVTTPSGTNIPEERMTVVGDTTARSYQENGRGGPVGLRPTPWSEKRVYLDVAGHRVHLGGPGVEEHPLGGFDHEPPVVLVGRAQGGHHRIQAGRAVRADRDS